MSGRCSASSDISQGSRGCSTPAGTSPCHCSVWACACSCTGRSSSILAVLLCYLSSVRGDADAYSLHEFIPLVHLHPVHVDAVLVLLALTEVREQDLEYVLVKHILTAD